MGDGIESRDHAMVHLIPAYRQKLKRCKPAVRTLKQWTSGYGGSVGMLGLY